MPRAVKAEHLAQQQKLKFDEPPEGVANHSPVQISLNAEQSPDSRPSRKLRGLPKEALDAWRSSLAALMAEDEKE
jgi:hypothetical protein